MQSTINPLVSIIVPVYNVEKYLDQCIQSILKQTYTNFELILINDGSTDSSLAICQKYADQDARIVLNNQKNAGVSAARNAGIKAAKGEWMTFIDSDDWVDNTYLESFIVIEIDEVDAVFKSFKTYDNNGNIFEKLFINNEIISVKDLINNYELYPFYNTPYVKLFRSSIVKNKIYFDTKIVNGEDTIFVLEFLNKVAKIYTLQLSDYNYRYNESGLSKVNYYNFNNAFNLYEELKKTFSKFNFQTRELSENRIDPYLITAFRSIYLNQEYDTKQKLEFLKLVLPKYKNVLLKYYKEVPRTGHFIYLLIKFNQIRILNQVLIKIS